MNLDRMMITLKRVLKTEYPMLDFDFEDDDQYVMASSGVTLNGVDGDIYLEIACYESGIANIRFVFGEVRRRNIALGSIDRFNRDHFLWMYLRDDNHVEVCTNMELSEYDPESSFEIFIKYAMGYFITLPEEKCFRDVAWQIIG